MSEQDRTILKLYERGTDRIDHDFNINRIITQVRKMRIFIKKVFSGKKTKFEIEHDKKNVLDLDDCK